jgi:hypothetical protein
VAKEKTGGQGVPVQGDPSTFSGYEAKCAKKNRNKSGK